MRVDVGSFGALSAVLKPAGPARHEAARQRSLLSQSNQPSILVASGSTNDQSSSPSKAARLFPLSFNTNARKWRKITYSRRVRVFSMSAGYITKLLRIASLAGPNGKNPLWSQIWRILASGWRSGCWRYAQVSLTIHWRCCSELNSLRLSAT